MALCLFLLEADKNNPCLPRLPRAIHVSDSVAYFTGVTPEDGTGILIKV